MHLTGILIFLSRYSVSLVSGDKIPSSEYAMGIAGKLNVPLFINILLW